MSAELPAAPAANSPDPLRALLAAAQAGDRAARDQVIQSNLGLVRSIVSRFVWTGYDIDDLFQVGAIGLMKAVDRFDLSLAVRFSTYAVPLILGEVRRCLRDDGPLRVPRPLKERGRSLRRSQEQLAQSLGREPTVTELAAATGLAPDQVVEALESTRPVSSLQEPAFRSEGGEPIRLEEQLAAEDGLGSQVDRLALRQVLDHLDPRHRAILVQRYLAGQSQSDIGRGLGISQVQVSRLERRALTALRAVLGR